MLEFYPEIRLIHIIAVLTSGALFVLRGLGLLLGADWPRAVPVKYLSYAIDTVLLIAAMMLMTMLSQFPFAQHWLTMKVVMLVIYIGLGIAAFRQGRRTVTRLGLWLAAMLVYGFIISVALAHHPLGVFA